MATHFPSMPAPEPRWRRLHGEHQRMGAILADVLALVEHGSYGSAARRFGQFRLCQERHMREEEALLELLPRPLPGTRELFVEHPQIARLMGLVSEAISRWDREAFRELLRKLQALLATHQEREQRALPIALRHVRLEDRAAFEDQLTRLSRA